MVEFSGSQDWNAALRALGPVFDGIRPDLSWASRDGVHQNVKRIIQTLDQDLLALRSGAKFIFAARGEAEDQTGNTVAMVRNWHLAERSPSLASIVCFALENFKVKVPDEIANGAIAAGALGEVENNLPYHNNLHYKKVLLQTIRLISVHNSIYHGTDQELDGRKVGLLLLAACIHDLGHDGKGNTIKGVFEQGRLERRAFELALPYLESCRVSNADLEQIRVMLLCTDVTPLGDPANPINQMKSAYRYHFLGQKKKMGPLNLDDDLAALQRDAGLTMMAIVLHEADMGTSAGLDYAVTTYETALYKKEMGESQAYPQDVVDFLNDICQRQMLSDAAQRLFAANMARIFALAEREIADGNHAYPQPEHSDFLLAHAAGISGGASKTIN